MDTGGFSMTLAFHSATVGSFGSYLSAKTEAIEAYPNNRMISNVLNGSVTTQHYQALLVTLFHQTRSGPYTFSMAASNCSWRNRRAKEYLLRHALEEANHWEWILDDLHSVGHPKN